MLNWSMCNSIHVCTMNGINNKCQKHKLLEGSSRKYFGTLKNQTDFCKMVEAGMDPHVDQFTRNFLGGLGWSKHNVKLCLSVSLDIQLKKKNSKYFIYRSCV